MQAGTHPVPKPQSCDVLIKTHLLTEADTPCHHTLQNTASNERQCGPRTYDGYQPTPQVGIIL